MLAKYYPVPDIKTNTSILCVEDIRKNAMVTLGGS